MPKKKINLGIKEGLHKQAKVISILKNITLNDFLISAIEDSLKKDLVQLKSFVPESKDKTDKTDKKVLK